MPLRPFGSYWNIWLYQIFFFFKYHFRWLLSWSINQTDNDLDFMCMGMINFAWNNKLLFIQAPDPFMVYVSKKCLPFLFRICIMNISLYVVLLWNFCDEALNIEALMNAYEMTNKKILLSLAKIWDWTNYRCSTFWFLYCQGPLRRFFIIENEVNNS